MRPANVGLLAVVSHPLKLTALAVVAVVARVAVAAFPVTLIPQVHEAFDCTALVKFAILDFL